MNQEKLKEQLDAIRNRIISEGYIIVIALVLPLYIFSLIYNRNNTLFGMTPSLTIMFILVVLLVVFMFRSKISFLTRTALIVGASVIMGCYIIIGHGLIGMGVCYIFFGITLLAINSSPSFINVMYYVTLSVITGLGFGINGKWITPIFDTEIISDSQYWTFVIISYAVLSALIIRSVVGLNKAMINALQDAIDKNQALDEAGIALKSNYEALLDKTRQIRELAYFDGLTGLPNKTSFVNKVTDLITRNKKQKFSVIYVDIDNQKVINKRVGPVMGDKIIKELARHMQFLLPEDAIVSRVDGDAFALITPYYKEGDLDQIVEQVNRLCKDVMDKLSLRTNLTCSIGVAIYPEHGKRSEQLLQNGEIALMYAKNRSKRRFFVYNESINQAIQERENMIEQLRCAVHEEEIYLKYQPKYSASNGKLVSFEALARWESKTHGFISPEIFVPLLEESALIIPFGYMVLRKALLQLKTWHEMGHKNLSMAVNVSAIQFQDPFFCEKTIQILEELEIAPDCLELEITESVFIDDFDVVSIKLQQFYDYGIQIGLDDFGTGYSSLNYLRNLPIHILKIDKSFVDVINDPEQEEVVLTTIIQLAHNLNMRVVAEGIENEAQKKFLEENGCDYLQGYYFSRPLLPAKIDLKASDNLLVCK